MGDVAVMSTIVFMMPGINPEPWEVGPVSWRTDRATGKRSPTIGPVKKLVNYQDALRIEFKRQYKGKPTDSDVQISMYFWRRLDSTATANGHKQDAKVSDSTNMQKATEDAMQGIIIKNDRQTKDIRSAIVEEGPSVDPGVLVKVRLMAEPPLVVLDPILLADFENRRLRAFSYDGLDDELRLK